MSSFKDPKKSTPADWHRADVVAALHKKGLSLRELSRRHSLSAGTLKNALDRPYPKAEGIIAAALGLSPVDIWPERCAQRNFTPVLTLSTTLSATQLSTLSAVA